MAMLQICRNSFAFLPNPTTLHSGCDDSFVVGWLISEDCISYFLCEVMLSTKMNIFICIKKIYMKSTCISNSMHIEFEVLHKKKQYAMNRNECFGLK